MESIRRVFCVDRREINYIRSTVESYDGMGVVKTLDPHEGFVEIRIVPGCSELVSQLLRSLVQGEGIYLKEIPVEGAAGPSF